MDKRRKKARALPPLKTRGAGHDHASQRDVVLSEEFRALSIGSPLPCTEVSPDPEPDSGGSSRGKGTGFPTIRVQKCEEAFFPRQGSDGSPQGSPRSQGCPAHCQCGAIPHIGSAPSSPQPGEDPHGGVLSSSPSPTSSRTPSPNVESCSLRPSDPLCNFITRNHRTITYYTPRGAANSDTPLLQHTHSDGNIDACGLEDHADDHHQAAASPSTLTISAPGTPVRSLSNPSSPVTSRKGQGQGQYPHHHGKGQGHKKGHHHGGDDPRLLPGRSEKKPVRLIPLKGAPVPKLDRSHHKGELPNL